MEIASALLTSAIVGLLLSAPIGPVALLTIRRALAGRTASAVGTGLGVATCDIVVAVLSQLAWGATRWPADRWAAPSLILCGVVFGVIGAQGLWSGGSKAPRREAGRAALRSGGAAWLEGLLLSACNPVNAAAVAVAVIALRGRASPEAGPVVVLGFALGCLVWWLGLAFGMARFRRHVSEKTLGRIDLLISLAILIGGVLMIGWGVRMLLV